MSEAEKIKQRYQTRESNPTVAKNTSNTLFSDYIIKERELIYSKIISNNFKNTTNIELIEIGAGSGANLSNFNKLGIPYKNIYANELIEERTKLLIGNYPEITIFSGDANKIDFKKKFDIVFQSTVFTSILDSELKKQLANKMFEILKPNGIVLWYDFTYDNPNNKDVKGVSKKEIIRLFPKAKKITFYKVTLAPPIGRRIGNYTTSLILFFHF